MDVNGALAKLGGPTEAAKRLRLNRSTVAMWKHKGVIPPRHRLRVARALGVSVETLWPEPTNDPLPAARAA